MCLNCLLSSSSFECYSVHLFSSVFHFLLFLHPLGSPLFDCTSFNINMSFFLILFSCHFCHLSAFNINIYVRVSTPQNNRYLESDFHRVFYSQSIAIFEELETSEVHNNSIIIVRAMFYFCLASPPSRSQDFKHKHFSLACNLPELNWTICWTLHKTHSLVEEDLECDSIAVLACLTLSSGTLNLPVDGRPLVARPIARHSRFHELAWQDGYFVKYWDWV